MESGAGEPLGDADSFLVIWDRRLEGLKEDEAAPPLLPAEEEAEFGLQEVRLELLNIWNTNNKFILEVGEVSLYSKPYFTLPLCLQALITFYWGYKGHKRQL